MRPLILLALILHLAVAADPDDGRAVEHAALRELLAATVTALNANDADGLSRCLAPRFSVTFADQSRFEDVAAITAYAAQLRKARGIQRIAFAPVVDAPARFLGPDAAIATGTSQDSFTAASGTTVLSSRWTATVERTPSGWRISSLHCGIDPFANPILDRVQEVAGRLLWWALGAGLLVGLIIGVLLGKRLRR